MPSNAIIQIMKRNAYILTDSVLLLISFLLVMHGEIRLVIVGFRGQSS